MSTGRNRTPKKGPEHAFRDRIVEFRRVRASELGPNPRNWRRHPEAQRDALASMLADVGFANAVLVREVRGKLQLIDGHLRAELADDAEVPVLVLDVTAAEADKLLATLDPLAGMAEIDGPALADLLSGMSLGSTDLLAHLGELAGITAPTSPKDPDDVPEPSAKPRTRAGDLWVLGSHRLLCGDATDPDAWSRLMGAERAAALWTDPPYGVDYVGKTSKALTIANDHSDAGALLEAALTRAAEHLIPSAPYYIAAPAGPRGTDFRAAIARGGYRLHQELVWVKDVFVLGHSDYHYQHEPILYGYAPAEAGGGGRPGRGRHAGSRWFGDHAQSSVFLVDRPKRSEEHPTMKPVGLITPALTNSTPGGAIVVDPFVGSGSTIIAAEQAGRRCFAMDIDPTYVDVAVRRWEEFTGSKAAKT